MKILLLLLLVFVNLSVLSHAINGKEDISTQYRMPQPPPPPQHGEWVSVGDPNSPAVRAIGEYAVQTYNDLHQAGITFVENLTVRNRRNPDRTRDYDLLIKGTAQEQTHSYQALVTQNTDVGSIRLISFHMES